MTLFRFNYDLIDTSLFTVSIEGIKEKDLDTYDWSNEFSILIPMCIEEEKLSIFNNKEKLKNTMKCLNVLTFEMHHVLEHHPIVVTDSTMDKVFYSKVEDFKDFSLPYDAFYINKRFDLDNGSIMGIFVIDLKTVLYYKFRTEDCSEIQSKKMVDYAVSHYHTKKPVKGSIINISFVYLDKEGVFLVSTYPKEIRENKCGCNEEDMVIIKKAYSYVANIITFLKKEEKAENHTIINGYSIKDMLGNDMNNRIIKLSK